MNSKISIIILNWNGLKDTLECLESVKKIDYPDFEVIVVDNGSTDGSAQFIRQRFPDVRFIQNSENLGYAEGNNVGIRYALGHGAEFVLVLNNDTIVDKNILLAFVKGAADYPDAGVFGAKIYNFDDPNRIWHAGGILDQKTAEMYQNGFGVLDDGTFYITAVEIDYACGCSLFFRREVAEKIGLFDPDFFLYYEDTDLCFRARRAGFKVMYIPAAKLWHKVSASFRPTPSPSSYYYLTRNRLLFARRNFPWYKRAPFYTAVVKDFFSVLGAKKFSLPKRIYWVFYEFTKPTGKAKLLGIRDCFLNRLGNGQATLNKLKTGKS